ncbi:MAG TPA: transcriptional regulator [Mycobacteriales bacterium]|nr:transcriptional regulator [Mycobacteriales bacterium]
MSRSVSPEPLARLLDLLGRRGALEVFHALEAGPLAERALVRRLPGFAPGTVSQRVEELRRLGAVEQVPESGQLRLSPPGRRLQGRLEELAAWAGE